jgi:hypothetical protein
VFLNGLTVMSLAPLLNSKMCVIENDGNLLIFGELKEFLNGSHHTNVSGGTDENYIWEKIEYSDFVVPLSKQSEFDRFDKKVRSFIE